MLSWHIVYRRPLLGSFIDGNLGLKLEFEILDRPVEDSQEQPLGQLDASVALPTAPDAENLWIKDAHAVRSAIAWISAGE